MGFEPITWRVSSGALGPGRGGGGKSLVWRAEGSRRRRRLHVLVHGAVPGELGLAGRQLQVEVVDCERDDDDEGQDEAQDEGEGLLQALPLVGDALVGWRRRRRDGEQSAGG